MSKNLFKITNPDCKEGQVKVGDTNFKLHYPAVNKNMSWSTIEPLIRQATQKYIFPYVCENAFCDLAEKFHAGLLSFEECDMILFPNGLIGFEDGSQLSEVESKLLQKLQDVVAYYTMYLAYPLLNSVASDMGIQESSSKEGTSNATAMWRYKNSRWEIMLMADSMMDDLLKYLSDLIQANDETLPALWKDCQIYANTQTCFFRNTAQLQECIDIKGSFRTFKALIPYINKAAARHIKPVLCDTYYNELCTQIKAGTLTAANKTVVEMVRRALSNYALVVGLPHLQVCIESDGIKMVSSTDGMNIKATANDAAIQRLIDQAKEDGDLFLYDLTAHLYRNADQYPTWKASDCYENKEEDCPCHSSNHEIGGISL